MGLVKLLNMMGILARRTKAATVARLTTREAGGIDGLDRDRQAKNLAIIG
jgi:hypothetical protein